MTAYRRLRRFVDRDLGAQVDRPGASVTLIAGLPFFGVPLVANWWLIPSLLFLTVWLGFVAYRLWWVLRTGLIDADRSDWIEPK